MSKKLLKTKTLTSTRHEPRASVATCHMLFAALLFFLIAGCSAMRSTTPDTALARVNGDPITVELMESTFTEKHEGHSAFLAGEGVVREVLQKVIDKQLLLQEARRIGLDHEPEIEQAVEKRRANRASRAFFDDKIVSQVSVSEEEIVEAHKRMGVRFQARHILVENQDAAQKVYDRIQGGEDFGAVAIKVSQADTSAKGGYMGIVSWGRLDPDLEDKLWSLEMGELSKPFQTREGWNLLYVTEKRTAPTPPLEKARHQIRIVLSNRDKTRRSERLLAQLEQRWKPQINEAALRAIVEARDKGEISSDTVLVDFGDEKITASEVLAKIDFPKLQKLADPIALRALRGMLEENIFRVLVVKEALAQGYGKKPDIEKDVEQLRNSLAVDYLLGRVALANVEASDEETRSYWETHKERFTEPAAVKFSMIVAESDAKAQEILANLKSGADFAVTARQVSTHAPSANVGGEMGWVTKGTLEPALEILAFSLKKGEMGSVKVKDSFVIIRIDDERHERLKPLNEVREQAKHLVLQEKSREVVKTWITKLREVAVIEIDDDAVVRATKDYTIKFREKAEPTHG